MGTALFFNVRHPEKLYFGRKNWKAHSLFYTSPSPRRFQRWSVKAPLRAKKPFLLVSAS